MKKIATIGSLIVKSVGESLENVSLAHSFLSINPYSFVKEGSKPISNIKRTNTEAYIEDINKTVFDVLNEDKPDYLLIDLLDARLNIASFLVGDTSYLATINNGLESYLKSNSISKNKIIKASEISYGEWCAIFTIYYEKLLKIFEPNQIILLDVRSAYICYSKDDRFYYMLNEEERERLDSIYEVVYKACLNVFKNVMVISRPELLYCDEHESKRFAFSLSSIYLDYVKDAISEYIEKGTISNLEEKCERCSKALKERVNNASPEENVWKDIVIKDLEGSYTDDFGNVINNLSSEKINLTLKGPNNIVNIHKSCKLKNVNIILGLNNRINIKDGCSLSTVTLNLKDNSEFNIGSKNSFAAMNVSLIGDSHVVIGNNNGLRGVNILLFAHAHLSIGNNNQLKSDGSEFRGHDHTKIIIKDDTLWSQGVHILNGDGHSIFDIETKKRINDVRDGKNTIVINNHVWVGKSVTLLRGTDVGEGSVIGINSLVTKKYPNNCIIAGSPAKIMRKNICWCFHNDPESIDECAPYINMTEED